MAQTVWRPATGKGRRSVEDSTVREHRALRSQPGAHEHTAGNVT